MSNFNGNELFLEPNTKQYGGHMVMTNVRKPTKTKYINVDTRFRDEYKYIDASLNTFNQANYNLTLPERITDVKTLTVTNIEIPITFYNISSNLGNNYFNVNNGTTNKLVLIPDGQYTGSTLQTAINSAIATIGSTPYTYLQYVYNASGSIFKTSNSSVYIDFHVDNQGLPDKYNVRNKLGWLLGFRNLKYTVTTTNLVSESFPDLNGPRYLYLAIEEFNKGNQNSFISPLSNTALINKNVVSRISLNNVTHPFQTNLPANLFNGLLKSDTRSYSGKIDLHKINIQLLNEIGIPMNLNGMDFSFCLEVEHE
jgi:hypothetical protein